MIPEPGKPQGYEETGSVSSAIPGLGFSSQSSTYPNHTYGMEADALAEVGHHGFTVDAQAMTALLFDFATHADYRAAVAREFDGTRQLFGESHERAREDLHRARGERIPSSGARQCSGASLVIEIAAARHSPPIFFQDHEAAALGRGDLVAALPRRALAADRVPPGRRSPPRRPG